MFFRKGLKGITKHKTGTYAGDGVDNRVIDIGVNLAAKSNVYVVIKAHYAYVGLHRIEYGEGDLTMLYGENNDASGRIKSFTDKGFMIGSAAPVNGSGKTYRYIVFWTN